MKQMRVLVVDEEPEIRELLRGMLNDRGIEEVFEAGDGVEALSILLGSEFDVVFTNFFMNEFSGLRLAEVAHEMVTKTCPVFVIVSGLDRGSLQASEELQAQQLLLDWIAKPIEEHELDRVLEKVVEHTMKASVLF